MPFHIGFLIFLNITQLDLAGPYEVLKSVPDAKVHLIWKTMEPVTAGGGMRMLPTITMAECPQLDLICVPGGGGTSQLMADEDVLNFIRAQAKGVRYFTSVCTGSLVLGAAGLLKGKRATSHWMSHEMLSVFGATPVHERVVIDGNLVTGGGVTAGIDFGLVVVAQAFGEDMAKAIQLGIEYDPSPPFDAGSPGRAGAALVATARAQAATRQKERKAAVDAAAEKLT